MGPNPWDRGTSRAHILEVVDNSLRRLKTDWIDLYQLHNYDPEVPMDEALEALDSLVKSGKVRYIGAPTGLCFGWHDRSAGAEPTVGHASIRSSHAIAWSFVSGNATSSRW